VICAKPAATAWIDTSARRPALAPLVHSTRPSANHLSKAAKARSGEGSIPRYGCHRSTAGIAGGGQIDATAGIAKFGVTIILVGPAHRLIQEMRHRPHLGDVAERRQRDFRFARLAVAPHDQTRRWNAFRQDLVTQNRRGKRLQSR